jgi:hypothetical protein
MSNLADLQAVLFNTEAAFCENLSSFSTALPIVDSVDLSGLARKKTPQPFVRQYMDEGYQDIRMPWDSARVTMRGRLTGLGASCAGAVPSSDMATFLGRIIGNVSDGLATGSTFTGGTALIPTTTVAAGVAAGALVRGGAIADGRVGGQWLPVGAHATNNLTLLIAAAGAPSAADVLYASKLLYPGQQGGEGDLVSSSRLQVLTSNGHFILRGVFPISGPRLSGLSPGEIPEWEVELGVSHVQTTSATFPNATTPQRHHSSPVSGGSFAINTVGTTARVTEALRSFAMTCNLAGEGIKGPGGIFDGQIITAARRKSVGASIEFVVDAEATGTHTWRGRWDTDENSALFWHALYSLSCADGRSVGIYFPKLALIEEEPLQIADAGYNRVRVKMAARTGGTLTTALTRSPWRIALA